MLRAFQPELDAPQTRQFTKTPARGTLQTRSLLKSENKVGVLPQTAAKGKRVALVPHTPAVPQSTKAAPKPTNTNRGALHDKTPHANRVAHQTPAPGAAKRKAVAATPFQPVKEQQTPSSLTLPSATRTRVRAPSNAFETPLPSGNHWDISDGSIDLGPSVSASLSADGIVEEEFDDIEYMPPTAVEPQYDPPFDMPDYKQLGSDLKSIAHIIHFEDEADWDPHADFDVDSFLPPSPTTPTLLSCASDSDDDSDLFPNVKRVAAVPPPSRPLAPSSRPTAITRPSRPTMVARPSVVPQRASSRAPARPTAPTPGAGRAAAPPPSAASRARPAAPVPTRRPAVPTTTQSRRPPVGRTTSQLKTAPGKGAPHRLQTAPNKRPADAVEIVITFDDAAFEHPMDDFVLDLQ